ncbi:MULTISPECIES: DUF305 domain-containing protein [unclassified Pseudomonas]|uniref:DUF305 domain-containing protein n=1 Tax=unclassified Pseudomonas TaxID=196821 RepID=UPI000BD5CEE1|nr:MULTISPECIES: DUF305 domain-containing protein [unclassified Pseudomonas]PVZ20535.1 hypothetical protein F474_01135 [Pseudomonas sp. URIL14HWK12:I12]PVZ27601.1 hypothetical protein F470_00790 [Pseudomonas sp. URIL14HWK12:I10]PVZ38490.1 hypothetical protein F472_01135 [Pseudomonas sp. URIL14HWK12:I11]SNZ03150.1 Uncharacterized protein conserved in bacteria [Pseudomonas sp. URIL14HWK12:I9]
MKRPRTRAWCLLAGLAVLAGPLLAHEEDAHPSAPEGQASAEEQYLQKNDQAMAAMMQGMRAEPSGSIDADFRKMMTAHHQGAIEMARLQLQYGSNDKLKRIAQEIIIEQQQEIAAMQLVQP